jgi:hypothetical protein
MQFRASGNKVSAEAEEYPLLEVVTRQRPEKTQKSEKTLLLL